MEVNVTGGGDYGALVWESGNNWGSVRNTVGLWSGPLEEKGEKL